MLTHREVVELVLRAAGRPPAAARPSRRRCCARALRADEVLAGPTAFATWDEARLLRGRRCSPRAAPADAEALGVRPRRMAEVLGAA